MKRSRKSMITVFTLLAIGVSTAAVEGMPTCERLIKTFKERRVRNTVSKDTLAKWALWGKSHPNFKPHPRPKYKITRQEVVQKVQFACEVPVTPVPQPIEAPPEFGIVEFPPITVDLPPSKLPDVTLVASNETPSLPFVPPYSPGIPLQPLSPVPEPSSVVLAFTGAAFLLLLGRQARTVRRSDAA